MSLRKGVHQPQVVVKRVSSYGVVCLVTLYPPSERPTLFTLTIHWSAGRIVDEGGGWFDRTTGQASGRAKKPM